MAEASITTAAAGKMVVVPSQKGKTTKNWDKKIRAFGSIDMVKHRVVTWAFRQDASKSGLRYGLALCSIIGS